MASRRTVEDNLNSFFKSSLTGKDQDVLENMIIDYFGDEGTVEREFNCSIVFIEINNGIIDITLQ